MTILPRLPDPMRKLSPGCPRALSGCPSRSPYVRSWRWAAPGAAAARAPRRPRARQRPPLESIFEADLALRTNPAATLDALRTLGVSRVKVFMPWRTVAPDPTSAKAPAAAFVPSDPGAYPPAGWAPFDTILRDAKARGMAIDLTVGQPAPDWATAHGSPPGPAGVWKPSAADFGAFMRAVGTRYSGTYRAAGLERSAAPSRLLGHLERAQLRTGSRAAGHRLERRALPQPLPRSARRRLHVAQGQRARQRHRS